MRERDPRRPLDLALVLVLAARLCPSVVYGRRRACYDSAVLDAQFPLEECDAPSPGEMQFVAGKPTETIESDELPPALQKMLGGWREELRARVIRPVVMEPTLDAAIERAQSSFADFVRLWRSMTMAMAPWIKSLPRERIERIVADSTHVQWGARRAVLRLGRAACECFAEAEHTRAELARDIVRLGAKLPAHIDDDFDGAFAHAILVADYGIVFAADLLRRTRPVRLPEGFAAWFASEALKHAQDARGLLAAPTPTDTAITPGGVLALLRRGAAIRARSASTARGSRAKARALMEWFEDVERFTALDLDMAFGDEGLQLAGGQAAWWGALAAARSALADLRGEHDEALMRALDEHVPDAAPRFREKHATAVECARDLVAILGHMLGTDDAELEGLDLSIPMPTTSPRGPSVALG